MRFVSHIRNFAVGIITERSHPTQYGATVVDVPGYTAYFTSDVTAADVEFAEREFENLGLMYGRTLLVDEVTSTPITNRLSVFDTEEKALQENWATRTYTDEMGREWDFKEYVEWKLANRAENNPDFRLVDVEAIQPPWPRYLAFQGSLDELMQRIADDGYDVGRVLAYERQSGQRPAVIEALEQLVLAQDADITEEVPA
jgi:hypothetical protein